MHADPQPPGLAAKLEQIVDQRRREHPSTGCSGCDLGPAIHWPCTNPRGMHDYSALPPLPEGDQPMDQGGSQSSRTSPDNVPLFRSNILEDPRPDRGEPEQGGTVARAVPKLGVLSEAMDQYQFPEDDE